MFKRILSAAIGIPIWIFFLAMGGVYLELASFAVVMIALYEFYSSTGIFNKYTVIVGIITSLYIYLYSFIDYQIFFTLLVFIFLIFGLYSKKINITKIGIFQISIFYIVIPIHLINDIAASEFPIVIWLIFLIAWSSDTFAYFIGRAFGKHKLSPKISPNKTIEGSIGGIIGAVLSSIAFYYYFDLSDLTTISLYIFFIICAAILSQLGDLVASNIKRFFKIKDFGNIMPGHGGLLDRFDSVIILIPVIYLFLNIV